MIIMIAVLMMKTTYMPDGRGHDSADADVVEDGDYSFFACS